MLTKKQNELLTYLIKRIESDGITPSYEEMCAALNLKSKSGIHRIIKALEERGFIKHLENKARAIGPLKHPNGQTYNSDVINFIDKFIKNKATAVLKPKVTLENDIPLLGKIAAGTPIEAISNYDNYIAMPPTLISSGEYYALSVDGNSMIDAGILDGDTVIINKKAIVKNGDIIVALIDKEEATLKRFRKKGDSIALEPANKDYKTHIYGPDRITVQGVLSSLIRKY